MASLLKNVTSLQVPVESHEGHFREVESTGERFAVSSSPIEKRLWGAILSTDFNGEGNSNGIGIVDLQFVVSSLKSGLTTVFIGEL